MLLDLDLLEMRFYLNGEDFGPAFVGFSAEGMFPAASLNVGQAAHFNFGQSEFIHPPSAWDGLVFHSLCEAGDRGGLQAMRSLKSLAVSSSPSDHQTDKLPPHSRASTAGEDRESRWSNEGDAGEGSGLQSRRRTLIESLIGMGFPVEWAIRAVDHCDDSMSESMAIAWIIERMEIENASLEDDMEGGLGGARHRGMDYMDAEEEDTRGEVKCCPDDRDVLPDDKPVENHVVGVGCESESLTGFWLEDTSTENEDTPAVYFPASHLRASSNKDAMGVKEPPRCNNTDDHLLSEWMVSAVNPASEHELLLSSELLRLVLSTLYARVVVLQVLGHCHSPCLRHDDESEAKKELKGQALSVNAASIGSSFCGQQLYETGDVLPSAVPGGFFMSLATLNPSYRPSFSSVLLRLLATTPACCGHLVNFFKLARNSSSQARNMEAFKYPFNQLLTEHYLQALTIDGVDFRLYVGPWLASLRLHQHAAPMAIHLQQDAGMVLCHAVVDILCFALPMNQIRCLPPSSHESDEEMWCYASALISALASNILPQTEATKDVDSRRDPDVARWWRTLLHGRSRVIGLFWSQEEMEPPSCHQAPSPQLLHYARTVGGILNAKVFHALLNSSTKSPSLWWRSTIFALCGDMLQEVVKGLVYYKAATASSGRGPNTAISEALIAASHPEDFLSVSRERRLIQMLASRLRKEGPPQLFLSSYIQSIVALLVRWQQLREVVGLGSDFTDVDLEDEWAFLNWGGAESPPKATHSLSIEEVTSTSITVSWTSIQQRQETQEGSLAPQAPSTPMSGSHGVMPQPAEGMGLSLQLAACSMWGAEPFTSSAANLPDSGTYTLDNLDPDTKYRMRLTPIHEQNSEGGVLISASTKPEKPFMFNPESKGSHLSLLSANMTVKNNVNKKWSTVLVTTSYVSGLHTWEVHVDR